MEEYEKYAQFLPDINNEGKEKNDTYKEHMVALENFVMVYSTVDIVSSFLS